jgi:LmbE family N-acetylglucosaminyl deacetylase/glycosyltransferase involved in cell wall biosynthesis
LPSEDALVPYGATAGIEARAVLVLAPHPDDEVFGCGGAIAQHVARGTPVRVVVLTDGSGGGDPARRVDECTRAAAVLGYGVPEFWALPDRGLYATAELAQRLARTIEASAADLVYAPSPHEVHPDHRQTTALLVQALAGVDRPLRVAFYEVGVPLVPNLLLDITPWWACKQAAADCFTSQLAAQDYQAQIAGLDRYRTYTLPREVQAAEAYCIVEGRALLAGERIAAGLAGAFTWERLHDPAASAASPPWPLVSVVVRSIGRPLLHEALDSLARQTWPALEVVVVAAAADHPPLSARCGAYPLRLVGTGGPLARSRAANVGLEAARGEYVLLLDDDDWVMPSHLERLVKVLRGQTLWRAAYTGVVCVDAHNRPRGQTFDFAFDPLRQRAGNLTPIHAVLFERALFAEGCRFDEALDRYEDWDFWLQIAARTAFAHVPGASAAYRIHASSGVHEDAGTASASSQAIHDKWAATWTSDQKAEIMARVWAFEDQLTELTGTRDALAATRQALAEAERARRRTEQDAELLAAERDDARHLAEVCGLELEAIRASSSWRLTAPLRWAGGAWRAVRQALRPAGLAAARQALAAGGPRAVLARARYRLSAPLAEGLDYRQWVRRFDTPDDLQRARWAQVLQVLPRRPLISVVMPVFNPPLAHLREAIASVRAQVYPDWELCIADDASTDPAVWPALCALAADEPRLKLERREVNGHIAEASNTALARAGGEFVALMDHDDLLPPQALLRVAEVLAARPDAQIVYSDEDKIDDTGRSAAYFKPDWNYPLFLGQNLVSHLGVYRTALVRDVGAFRTGYDGAQDYDLALRCLERIAPAQVLHIPEVLYHWRIHPGSTALAGSEKDYAAQAAGRALRGHFERRGVAVRVEPLPCGYHDVVPYANRAMEGVTLIVVGAAGPATLPVAGAGVVETVAAAATRDAVNAAVAQARGRWVALWRAGLEAEGTDGLERLWRWLQMDGVGLAAGTVRDGGGRLRAGGLVLHGQGRASVLHAGLPREHPGYMGRAALTQALSAVSLDVCMVRRDAFLAAGGLAHDPGRAAAIDLGLNLAALGWAAVWCPPASWRDDGPQAEPADAGPTEVAVAADLVARRRHLFVADPAYHRALDAERADFTLRKLGPRPWRPQWLALRAGAPVPAPSAQAAP